MDVEERHAAKSSFLSEAGPRPIDKYMYLRDLRVNDTNKYYQYMLQNAQQVLPFIYTPTVGQACQEYHSLGIKTRGLYITLDDRGSILDKLRSWHTQDIQAIVVTDGERILGLGDLGANGMGISEGKIELYTAAAGVDPSKCLPIALDAGTNNVALREHPEYKGLRRPRPKMEEYDAFVDEFMQALKAWRPHVLLQFEDFGNTNAFRILDKYQKSFCCFNDDIQGTASITLAALLGALRIRGGRLSEQRILFLGAGEAACGIATLISYCMHRREGLSEEDSRQRCFLIDSKGLVCASRNDLQHHKQPFAHDVAFTSSLIEAVRVLKPTALIGVSAVPNTFDEEVIRTMAEMNERPIIFPLSNPTSLSECTFEQAVKWTDGRVIFASGSPFDPIVDEQGQLHNAPQANNAYIFPAVGHAAILTKAKTIPPAVFMVAAEQLAAMSTIKELSVGSVFPQFSNIRNISAAVMAASVRFLVNSGVGTIPSGWEGHDSGEGVDWRAMAAGSMWSPASASRL
ncbi:hypothetical protein PLESTB_000690000 [Pleodorina starrii]|uniref:Malic enzyme n=1 Tax=Pleodorina starrii TaxID=330485 RepID=A0A9W6F278_9CHLO|nr:hypothetical protein PLESTM_001227300 [Pleodorina starrii]GLC52936.1 hypothetical protein PLESTB_000690000 [Pleodorina starrii]GLC65231.1 hypothetical protein PLESTF_000266200 [Pleodorina starrii]